MKPFKSWTFQNRDNPEQKYTLYGVEEPNWQDRIASAGQVFILVASGPVVFSHQGEAESLARELTTLTGETWEYDLSHDHPEYLNHDNYYLKRPDGLTIFFNTDFNGRLRGRWKFFYSRPRGSEGYVEVYRNGSRVPDPKISVSKSRGAAAIAKEIVRRLIPEAVDIHSEILERIASQQQARKNQSENTAAIVEALGVPGPNPGKENFFFWFAGTKQTAEVGYSGDVSFKITYLPIHKALALARWLKENA